MVYAKFADSSICLATLRVNHRKRALESKYHMVNEYPVKSPKPFENTSQLITDWIL